MITLLQAVSRDVNCWECVDWPGIITALATLVGALAGALVTYARMRADYRLGKSLRPGPRPRRAPPERE